METKNEKISVAGINSANVRMNNHNDAERQFDIKADVNVAGASVTHMESGVVYVPGTEDAPECLVAEFSDSGNLRLNFQCPCDRVAVLTAIDSFTSSVREKVENGIF